MDKKKQPKGSDIHNLQKAQEYEQEYNYCLKKCQKYWNEKSKMGNTAFFSGLFALLFLMYDDPVSNFIFSICGLISIFTGFFYWSYRKGEGIEFEQWRLQKCLKNKDDYLKKVNCDYIQQGDKFYVYLEDGRKIEVDEY